MISISMQEPKLSVGIMFESKIDFSLLNAYLCNGKEFFGNQTVEFCDGKIHWNGSFHDELVFTPQQEETDSFELFNVNKVFESK